MDIHGHIWHHKPIGTPLLGLQGFFVAPDSCSTIKGHATKKNSQNLQAVEFIQLDASQIIKSMLNMVQLLQQFTCLTIQQSGYDSYINHILTIY